MKRRIIILSIGACSVLQGCPLPLMKTISSPGTVAATSITRLPLPPELQGLRVQETAKLPIKDGTIDCGPGSAEKDCPVNVMMKAPTSSTNCQAVITDAATVVLLKGTKRKLVWTLGQDSGDSGYYEFHKTQGIFIAKDDDNQIPNVGGYMNGNRTTFWRRDKNDKAGSFVLYMPVVFRSDTPGGPVTLCDTVDPKIVNDGP
jgi:hypothetical protein